MKLDSFSYPYPSRRNVVFAKKGMVATSQVLAAEAGAAILRKGGNAVDAAVATAACLTIVEPTSNGIGGDAFALLWIKGKLYGLNASGFSSKALTYEKITDSGFVDMPRRGWLPVTVPGVPAAWQELLDKFGRLSLEDVLESAIQYAEGGFPVSPTVSHLWDLGVKTFTSEKGAEFKPWHDTFTLDGRAPFPGEIMRLPNHAETLKRFAKYSARDFYEGDLAEEIDEYSRKTGGFLRKEDLASFKPEWVEPININYHGYDVWEIPPNGHGAVALMALNILKKMDFSAKETAEAYHMQMEAIKLAYADGLKYIADPSSMEVSIKDLLSDAFADERRKLIGHEAILPVHGKPSQGGTVYLATADEEGNMVSYIQSNYQGFGSGIVIPKTGIALHNRGANFVLDKEHANCYAPGKKPYHTIIPGFLTKENKAVGPFGVMGAFVQPQGHMQMVVNTINFHLNPQASLDAPRWQWIEDKIIEIEPQFPNDIALELRRRGHDIRRSVDSYNMGRGQIIWRLDNGVFMGATEPRADGAVCIW